MEKKFEKLLDMFITALESGADLAKTEAPKFMEEILAYGLTTSILSFALLFLGSLTLLLLGIKFYKECETDQEGVFAGACVFVSAISLFLFAMSYCSLKTVIKIKTAPRLYIMEELRRLK